MDYDKKFYLPFMNMIRNEENKNDKYFDAAFNRINKIISERKNITNCFNRFKSNINTKFSINAGNDDDDLHSNSFLDEMHKHLLSKGIDNHCIESLKYFVFNQQYESDSIEYDLLNVANHQKKTDHKDDKVIEVGENIKIKTYGGKSNVAINDDDNKNETGNIEKGVNDKHCIESIKEFIKSTKSYCNLFFILFF